jgi:hypothetical protein
MLVLPHADRLLPGVEKPVASDGGLLSGVEEPVPDDEAGDKQVSFADQDMEEFKLEWHLKFLPDGTHDIMKQHFKHKRD